jgi:hypothetical protein
VHPAVRVVPGATLTAVMTTDGRTEEAVGSTEVPTQRSPVDRVVRQLLLIGDASPRALFDLKGSMLIAGTRCTITYIIVPFGAPVIAWLGVLATPLSLALSLVAIGMAVSSLRRVWLADYRHRYAYSLFIVLAVVLLVIVVIGDVRILAS